jgi:hypothetical protein
MLVAKRAGGIQPTKSRDLNTDWLYAAYDPTCPVRAESRASQDYL